jgi:hypothetical protein
MKRHDKPERMAIRRDIGNRQPSPPKSPALGVKFLVAHACFSCRKSFKIPPRDEEAICPNCGGSLRWMGRSFKAPPMRDLEQWGKVQALWEAGFRFFSYRSFDCVPFPAKLSEVEAFVRENPNHPFRVAEPNNKLESDV